MKSICFFICVLTTIHLNAQLNWEEVNIPMSDDQSLKADIYLPGNWTTGAVILIQTPYNKNLFHLGLPLGIGQAQSSMGYAFVILDWRGYWGSSSAAYQGAPTMGEDGYDAVQWIAAQPWCDGNVGTWGPSALGKVQFATAKQQPPNLKCMVPLVAASQFDYKEYYPGGAYRVEYLSQLSVIGFASVNAIVIANPYYNFAWNIAQNANYYPDEITIPTLMIAGWYDHNIDLQIPLFAGLQNESPQDVRDKHRLFVGPWVHGGHSTANPGSATQGQLSYPEAAGWNNTVALQFFDYYLKGIENGMDETPAVQYFQMGDNEWLGAESWPVQEAQTTNLYFHADGKLSSSLPAENNASLSYEYDPYNPSPTVGGPTLRNDLEQGPYDQTDEVESRDDILIFTTDVLTQDVVLKGKAQVKLKISSDVTDTDFAIRLCDVYPDGRSMLVCDGIFRMRFRNGFTQASESFMTQGTIYECTIELPNTALTFLEGHRIRVDVTSSNYPRFNRNMNTGGAMYPNNNGDILVNAITAENTVHTSSANASHIVLPLVGGFPSVGIAGSKKESGLLIYPNPAKEKLNIFHLPGTPSMVRITDSKGIIAYETNNAHTSFELDLNGWASGIYTVIVFDGMKISSQRFVVR